MQPLEAMVLFLITFWLKAVESVLDTTEDRVQETFRLMRVTQWFASG